MLTKGAHLKGNNGQEFILADEIAHGGEGMVFNTNVPGIIAKIYIKKSEEIERKILYMTGLNVATCTGGANPTPILAWPETALYADGEFVGYTMPLVKDTIPIFQFARGGAKARKFIGEGYSWLTHLTIAYNLANTIRYLHSIGCIIGDMNGKNILVHRNGLVTILDVDSFDLTNPETGEHFPCTVGRPEFLPPELQGKDLRNAQFTVHSDEFGLAVHIFRLLLHNRHPFDVKIVNEGEGSVPESQQEYNISMGKCAYVRTVENCKVPPNEPTMDMLPDALREDFANTFNYTDETAVLPETLNGRTSSEKWYIDLKDLCTRQQELFQQCSKNHEHYYLKSKNVCEFCRVNVDGDLAQLPKPPHVTPGVTTPVPPENSQNSQSDSSGCLGCLIKFWLFCAGLYVLLLIISAIFGIPIY